MALRPKFEQGPGLTRDRLKAKEIISNARGYIRSLDWDHDTPSVAAAEAKRERRHQRNILLVAKGALLPYIEPK